MSTRTFHHKNRHGCLTCKQRRKKCDLQRPVCATCRRLGLKCLGQSLPYSSPSLNYSRPGPVLNATHFVHSLHRALANQPQFFEAADFQLASHFLHTAHPTQATIPGLAALRNLDFTAISQQYPYLLHGALAASALHIASQESSGGSVYYKHRAHIHQQLALSSYVTSLRTIDARSCKFIFGFSIILAGVHLAFCSSTVVEESNVSQANLLIESIIEIFQLMQGAVAVAYEARNHIPECRTEPLLLPIREMLQKNDFEIDREAGAAFDALEAQIIFVQTKNARSHFENANKFANSTVYLSALQHLRGVFGCLGRGEPDNFKAVIGWPAFVERSFVQMVRKQQPAALVILAFFGVALYTLRSAWWLQSTGSKLVLAIDGVLHMRGAKEWYAFSAWALSRVSHSNLYQFSMCNFGELSLASSQQHESPSSPFEVAYDHICSISSLGEELSTHTSTHSRDTYQAP